METSDDEDDGVDEDFQPDPDSESDNDEEAEERNAAWRTTCAFDSTALAQIHACICDTFVPTWITRPPTNLGEKSHGKLKADQWWTLFTIFLPIVLPELWLASGSSRDSDLLDNFHHLVMCTNIIGSYVTSNQAADNYLDHYIKYRESSKSLFPKVRPVPNHHYAMHNGEMMKFWGPLPLLSEFPFEQLNGTLQKISTNWHLCAYSYVVPIV